MWLCDSEVKQGQAGEVQELQGVSMLELQQELESRETLYATHSDL